MGARSTQGPVFGSGPLWGAWQRTLALISTTFGSLETKYISFFT